jgi:alkylation response protein AidB-like acyl-CoA dehydrogenase
MTTDVSLRITSDHRDLQKWAHDFAEEQLRPVAAEWDRRQEFPWPVLAEAARIGLHSPDFVDAAAADPTGLSYPIVGEEIAWGDPGLCIAIMSTGMTMRMLKLHATTEQLDEWVPQCFGTVDDPHVVAVAISEADAGSDISRMRTRAVYHRAGDEWVLNGTKAWVTNGGVAQVHIVVAVVDSELGASGQAAFLIPPGTAGFSQGRKYEKLGIRASHTAEVVLDEVRVPGRCLLGGRERLEERLGQARAGQRTYANAALATLERTRPLIGAYAVGTARAAFEHALAYAKERVQFGRPIGQHQAIGFQLVDMKASIDAARLLVWRAAALGANGHGLPGAEGSMAKLVAAETAVEVTQRAIQILGGAGFTTDHPVERWYRDAKIFSIFEGTSEIQRLVIARALLSP